jgi:beta-galactosidase/beta-glucuronidase
MLYPIQNQARNRQDLSGIWDFQADPDETGATHAWFKQLEKPRLPFEFEITAHVRWDQENVFAISVENHLQAACVPAGNIPSPLGSLTSFPCMTYDFFPFAGLHRPVLLYTTPQTSIADVGVRTSFRKRGGKILGKVDVRVRLSDSADAQATAVLTAATARHEVRLNLSGGEGAVTITVPDARLWSDQDPFLYDLTIDTGADQYTLKIGIRTVAVRKGEVLLNGQPVKLNGYGRHMGGPHSWLENCDVVSMNRYWGWYVMGGELDRAFGVLEQELDQTWFRFQKPIIMTEFGADTMARMHGHPAVMWTEEYQAEYIRGHLTLAGRKKYIAGMQVWNFADFAAVQGIMRVGGLNMKGVFTRTRTPKMAAQVLREFWTPG